MALKSLCSALALLTAVILGGCVNANVSSARSANYDRMPKNMFIMAALGPGFKDTLLEKRQTNFGDKFQTDLHSCGIASEIAFVETTALHIATDEKIKNFGPDATLSIQVTSGLSKSGGLIEGFFHLEMRDMVSKVVVWNANLHLDAGSVYTMGSTGEVFEATIINQMVADRVLPANCLIPRK